MTAAPEELDLRGKPGAWPAELARRFAGDRAASAADTPLDHHGPDRQTIQRPAVNEASGSGGTDIPERPSLRGAAFPECSGWGVPFFRAAASKLHDEVCAMAWQFFCELRPLPQGRVLQLKQE